MNGFLLAALQLLALRIPIVIVAAVVLHFLCLELVNNFIIACDTVQHQPPETCSPLYLLTRQANLNQLSNLIATASFRCCSFCCSLWYLPSALDPLLFALCSLYSAICHCLLLGTSTHSYTERMQVCFSGSLGYILYAYK